MTTWRAIYERMFERGPDSFSQPERETIRAAIEEAWNAGAAARRHPVSTLRERIEALAKEWEMKGNSPVRFAYHEQHAADSAEADTFSRCAEALRSALESETQEAPGRDAALRALRMAVASDSFPVGRPAATYVLRAIDALSTPPPANTENDR